MGLSKKPSAKFCRGSFRSRSARERSRIQSGTADRRAIRYVAPRRSLGAQFGGARPPVVWRHIIIPKQAMMMKRMKIPATWTKNSALLISDPRSLFEATDCRPALRASNLAFRAGRWIEERSVRCNNVELYLKIAILSIELMVLKRNDGRPRVYHRSAVFSGRGPEYREHGEMRVIFAQKTRVPMRWSRGTTIV